MDNLGRSGGPFRDTSLDWLDPFKQRHCTLMGQRGRFERKAVSLILALASLATVFFPSPVIHHLDSVSQKMLWAFLMICVATLQLAGLWSRKVRHIGFVLSSIQWFSMAMTFGGLSFSAGIFILLGIASIVAYFGEVTYTEKKRVDEIS